MHYNYAHDPERWVCLVASLALCLFASVRSWRGDRRTWKQAAVFGLLLWSTITVAITLTTK